MLTQAGQKAPPVWKQILSSLFSWQTALTTGIMLLIMYGDEFVDWVGSLFKGEKQLTAAERAQRGLNDAIKENGYGIGDTIVTVRKLSDKWAALGGNLKEQQKFIKDSKDEFNKLGVSISNVNDIAEEIGRLYGYHNLVSTLPVVPVKFGKPSLLLPICRQ